MRRFMINKMSEMELEDETNDMDFGIWNEWDEGNWQVCNIWD